MGIDSVVLSLLILNYENTVLFCFSIFSACIFQQIILLGVSVT